MTTMITVTLRLKTTNPNNGTQGWSRTAALSKARARKDQRAVTKLGVLAKMREQRLLPSAFLDPKCVATITRIAPSSGLDPHDGLGAALKGVIDGVADALGLKNDRDSRIEFKPAQERGPKGRYAVRVSLVALE